ncbi:MAG: thiamine-phosphate kinase [bacterium]|nr:thiamine-phosphate kinase [bacterium]MDD5353775.1 thiamine-phosphate kinase [bacterium]MDD5756306.1 thiamine-phosphate kinase [bacterium]
MAQVKGLTLGQLGEFGLIQRVARIFGRPSRPGLVQGIGDDAAVVKIGHNKALVYTTDMLIEDVHFSLKYEGFLDVGWKALAVNISDIASMGATPTWGVISVGVPVGIPVDNVDNLAQGVASLARKYQIGIIGGDTVKSPDRLVVNIALLGEAPANDLLFRHGASPGDALFVTNCVGEAAAGLEILRRQTADGRRQNNDKHLIHRYLRPEPRVKESVLIVKYKLASSMIDISDGLHISVSLLCQQSKVGAIIYLDKIPLNNQLSTINYQHALQLALSGGEDYELLFTVPQRKIKKALALFPHGWIGVITKDKAVKLLNPAGREVIIKKTGYEHFK